MTVIQLPHTIDNGHGERLTFREVVDGTDGPRLLVANEIQPGCGPVMHVHFRQSEGLTVRAGRLGYQLEGEDPQVVGPGESVTFRAGCPHRFWADGGEVLHCDGWVSPPENFVWFLSEVYRSMSESEKGRPGTFDAAYLLGRYRGEYDLLTIPGPVKKLVFPVVRGIGRATGRFGRFRDAPTPLPTR